MHRKDESGAIDRLGLVGVVALVVAPAEVGPRWRAGPEIVDLLPAVLPDVADQEVAIGLIKAETPRVAQAVGVDARPRSRSILVHTQDLCEKHVEVLSVEARVTLAAAVTDADVEPVSYTHLRAHETRHDLVCR